MKYAEISVEVDSARSEELVAALVGEGLPIEERDSSTVLRPSAAGRVLLIAYASADDADATQALVQSVVAGEGLVAEVRREDKDEENWRDAWKAFFKAVQAGPFAIVPSWQQDTYERRPGDIVIKLDPGRAFGTGGHASTRLCLQAIGRLAPGSRILDVGCGSGVLGVACALRDRSALVTAIDVDPEAIEVTVENATLNGVADRISASTEALAQVSGRFDLVVANIQADVLVRLAPALSRRTAGALVLSGVLVEQGDLVAAAFVAEGLLRQDTLVEDGWCALVFLGGVSPA